MTHAVTQALMAAMPLSEAAESGVPDWIHLLPAGRILTQDGRGPYSGSDLASIIAASGVKLPVDENHAIHIAARQGLPSPARGYIVELQARSDGLWGRMDWTDEGRALMADRAYLGISPVITHDAAFRITSIQGASLTNRPNFKGLTALHQQETIMSLAARLAQVLGLDASTGEDALVDRITSLHQAQTATTALHSSLARIGVALGVPQDAKPEAVEAAAMAAGKTGTDLVPALQAENATLKGRLDTIEADRAREKAVAFVDGAKASGNSGINPETLTDLERAARVLYLQRTAFGGKVSGRNFGVAPERPARFNLTTREPMLEDLHSRLSGVVIECLDFARSLTGMTGPARCFISIRRIGGQRGVMAARCLRGQTSNGWQINCRG